MKIKKILILEHEYVNLITLIHQLGEGDIMNIIL